MAVNSNTDLVLKYYLLLRCLIVIGLAIGITLISINFGLRPPWAPSLIIVAVLAGATWLTLLRKNPDNKARYTDLVVNLLIDVAALFLFAYYTGGSTNPFVTLFALPVIFAAATLPLRGSATIAIAAIAAYTVTLFVNSPLDPDRLQINVSDEYLWGNWYAFVLVVAGIAALVARLSRGMRMRDLELSEAREDALQADRVVALGTLAARAAQDLGTPLTTIAVLAKDLETEATDADARSQLQILNAAVGSCKDILASLSADAGQQPAASGHATTADSYVADLVERWGNRHPSLSARLEQHGPQPAPQILTDQALDQAILILLDSATATADKDIVVTGGWTSEALDIGVKTSGPATAAVDDTDPLKSDSMGTGLFLAIATLKRLGGDVNFTPVKKDRDAAFLQVSIPLDAIKTS